MRFQTRAVKIVHIMEACSEEQTTLDEGKDLDAALNYLERPVRTETEYKTFLQILQSSLDHVISLSPAHLPQLLEAVYNKHSEDDTVMLLLGMRCLDEEMFTEAEFFLERATKANPDCLSARETLRTLHERVVPRWHFLMLNDITRNLSYSQAIANTMGSVPDCVVMDIGSGTGLLRYGSIIITLAMYVLTS